MVERGNGQSFKVALAQISPRLGDIEFNLKKHLDWIERAVNEQADLVVFPELSLSGYFLRDLVPQVAVRAHAERPRQSAG